MVSSGTFGLGPLVRPPSVVVVVVVLVLVLVVVGVPREKFRL